MSFNKQLKPETIERRKREENERQVNLRERFLANYATVREQCGLPDPPISGSHFATDLADGRAVIVTANGVSVF